MRPQSNIASVSVVECWVVGSHLNFGRSVGLQLPRVAISVATSQAAWQSRLTVLGKNSGIHGRDQLGIVFIRSLNHSSDSHADKYYDIMIDADWQRWVSRL